MSFPSLSSSCSVASTASSLRIDLYDILLNIYPTNILKRFSSVFLIGGTLLYIDAFLSSFLFCLLHPPQLNLSANQDTEDAQVFACPAPVALFPIFLPCRWWALKAADPCSLFWAEPGWAPLSKARPPYAHRQALLLSLAQGRPRFPHNRARYSFALYYDSCCLQIPLSLAPPMRTICLGRPHQELLPHYNTASLGKRRKSECQKR